MNLEKRVEERKKYLIYKLFRLGVMKDENGVDTNNLPLSSLELLHIKKLNQKARKGAV